jgi:MFS family permease
MGMMMYFPMFLQGIQGISTMRSGQIITPSSVIMSFIGVPVGFLLARSKHYKWLYVVGFAIITVTMFGVIFFTAETSIAWSLLAAALSGVGLGALPTVNTMVIQSAVPKRLVGVAMGASFFNLMMGVAIAPAVLGAAMNATYSKTLAVSLPAGLKEAADETTMASLGNSRVLLSKDALAELEGKFQKMGGNGPTLFKPTVQAIRASMQAGLRMVFMIGAITMLVSFLIILTLPEISLGTGTEDTSPPKSLSRPQPAGIDQEFG